MIFSTPKFPIDHERVVAAIAGAEQRTSGEIRVAVARRATPDPMAAAGRHFHRLGMEKTGQRNGVLIFVSPRSRNFAVIGDVGVHQKCGDAFWQTLANAMSEKFRAGDFEGGLLLGIERAGSLLAEHFPLQPGDQNELPNDVEDV